ncbi:MAG: HAMP domain-containing protein [Chloroflexi bacterium]|nr:HAMP domain-containing protein [Chloroflexota bacterium]
MIRLAYRIHRALRSLRARLIASFVLIILVTVGLVGSTVFWQMQRYRSQLAVEHLQDLAVAAAGVAWQLEWQGAGPETIGAIVASQVGPAAAYVLVLDQQGQVLSEHATEAAPPPLEGSTSPLFADHNLKIPAAGWAASAGAAPGPAARPQPRPELRAPRGGRESAGPEDNAGAPDTPDATDAPGAPGAPGAPRPPGATGVRGLLRGGGPVRTVLLPRAVSWAEAAVHPVQRYVFVTAALPVTALLAPSGGARPGGVGVLPTPSYRIVLATPAPSLAAAWREFGPRLAPAIVLAIVASAALSWWLAQSIARPLRRITRATEKVALGELHQPLPDDGAEEVRQLARSFNRMSREVAQSQQALRDFIANASHELRTPLTSIQGFSQALLEDLIDDPSQRHRAARVIHDESGRMRRLVDDLLLLSKMESGAPAGSERPVDVLEVLEREAARIQPLAGARGVHLSVALDALPDPLTIDGDPHALTHLFGNLLENAAKYTPSGGTITMSARIDPSRADGDASRRNGDVGGRVARKRASPSGESHSAHLVVSVHNTGSYITPEDLARVFERFYRADKAHSRVVEGTGLGLAIAHEVARRHGGGVMASSDRTTGTQFVARLPLTGSTS